jgi:hypothetical protein
MVDSEEEEEAWEECDQEMEDTQVTCLFCSQNFSSAEETFTHCRTKHDLDLVQWSRRHSVDCIQYIKMINYIRQKVTHCIQYFKMINYIRQKVLHFNKVLLKFLVKPW